MAKAKRIRGLKCNQAATASIRLVLLTRFEELQGWREAALDWSDPEGVHSMRVASRRLRSALRDFMPYVRKRNLNGAVKQLRTIADALGRVRDLDVAILALEEIEKQSPPKLSSGVQRFIDARKKVLERAREELKSTLLKSERKQLESEFRTGVDKAVQVYNEPAPTFAAISQTVIADRLREFERMSNGLFKPLDVDALHRMRMAVKRLRYAVELFQQCWPRSISASAKRAARIQSALGDLHDCDVWIETLGKHIKQARKQKEEEYVTALVWLLGHLIKLRTKYLRRALTRWREWETQDTGGRLRAALDAKDLGVTPKKRRSTAVPVAEEATAESPPALEDTSPMYNPQTPSVSENTHEAEN